MAGLKVVDINKVEPERKIPPRASWILISEKTVGAQNLALGVNETEPGSMVPEHMHETEEEVMLFLEGEGKFITKDQEIDLKPGIKPQEMDDKLLREFREHGAKEIKSILSDMMPVRLAPVIAKLTGLDVRKRASQIGKEERKALAGILNALPVTVTGTLPIEEAMVTCGGVSVKEINPRTMESKIVPGLYFAGEIIEGGAPSGGYNLQQAFSTGYLAGGCAAGA